MNSSMLAPQKVTAGFTHPYMLLLTGFILLFPFYVFSSGGVQPSHLLLAALFSSCLALKMRSLPNRAKPVVTLFGGFVLYVFTINMTWTVIVGSVSASPEDSPFISSFFYLYNFLAFVAVIVLYGSYGNTVLKVIFYAVSASVFIQFLLLPISLASAIRQELFFNNPNQLGYYLLTSATIFAIGSKLFKPSNLHQVCFFMGLLIMAALSESKAAVFGIGLLLAISFYRKPLMIIVTGAAMLLIATQINFASDAFSTLGDRIASISYGQNDDSFEARGYGRIGRHPQYWLAGAGEGAYHRFVTGGYRDPGKTIEIHSTFGTIFFSYGIVGLLWFVVLLFRISRRAGVENMLLLSPVLFYGITHNGTRATLFWILLAFVLGLGLERQATRRRRKNSLAIPPVSGVTGANLSALPTRISARHE